MVYGEWYKIKLIEIDIKWFFYGIINVVLFFILLYLDIQICLLVYRKGFHIELLFIIILFIICYISKNMRDERKSKNICRVSSLL